MRPKTFFANAAVSLTVFFAVCTADAASASAANDAKRTSAWLQNAMSSGVFLAYHPDVRGQQHGIRYYRERRYDMAYRYFEMGARYSDKASQAMLAQMHWRGEGAMPDKAKAYAWMDLAAERGYPVFLAEREKMWNQLTDNERDEALGIGRYLLTRYGDDVARPRLAQKMRAGRFRTVTGSRAGYDAGVRTLSPNTDGSYSKGTKGFVTGHGSFRAAHLDDRLWHPERYWQIQDRIWDKMPTGEVIVHPLEQQPTTD